MPMKSVRTPFANMSFSPDVPATALGPTEYNAGLNVETDVRGVRSVNGSEQILNTIPGTATFVTGGFRLGGEFWFVVATTADGATPGRWLASNGTIDWYDITPTDAGFDSLGYAQNTNVTESWNGTVLFLNDEHNPPFFWPDQPDAVLVSYSNQVPLDIVDIQPVTVDTKIITFDDISPLDPPFAVGAYVQVANVNPRYYNGTWLVTACTTSSVTIVNNVADAYGTGGTVAPAYTWNYNPDWSAVYAKFMRLYNTPNVGSILVAGNLTATNAATDAIELYPVTVQWSQAFGLNQAPTTWTPTVTNVANQLEVPLRGPALDAFPCNGQFFLCSYWDTVVFSPINYSTTSAPILGVRQFNQGRGLLSSNCWANTDKLVYGIDARDIWVFDGSDFKGLGNQRVRNWLFDQLDPQYYDRVFMETNTQKYQIEIYYPDADAVDGVPNKMLAYRYDIDCFNAPRNILAATFACESPVWNSNVPDLSTRCVVYARGQGNVQLLQKDQGFAFVSLSSNTVPIDSSFRRDNIKLAPDYNNHVMVHRILPEVVNLDNQGIPMYPSTGNVTVTVEGAYSVGSEPTAKTPVEVQINTDYPWAQIDQNEFRVNTLEISNSSNVNIWMCNAVTWQVTQVEDDR